MHGFAVDRNDQFPLITRSTWLFSETGFQFYFQLICTELRAENNDEELNTLNSKVNARCEIRGTCTKELWHDELSCFCDAENSIFIDETEFEIALCCRKKTVVLKKQTEESRDG